jgi:hypothetical protein
MTVRHTLRTSAPRGAGGVCVPNPAIASPLRGSA